MCPPLEPLTELRAVFCFCCAAKSFIKFMKRTHFRAAAESSDLIQTIGEM